LEVIAKSVCQDSSINNDQLYLVKKLEMILFESACCLPVGSLAFEPNGQMFIFFNWPGVGWHLEFISFNTIYFGRELKI
jgi:hypothetical protein